MAVPTKEAGRTEPRDGAAPELSSIQFSAQFTEEITESQEPQPDTAGITETPGIPGIPDMPGALPEDDILSQAELAQQETAAATRRYSTRSTRCSSRPEREAPRRAKSRRSSRRGRLNSRWAP